MQPTSRLQYWFNECTTAVLVLLFLYTAILKLRDRSDFIGAMGHNPMLAPYKHILGWFIPAAEIIVVIILSNPKSRRVGLLFSAILMAAFTGYVGYMLVTSYELPCTCGGILKDMSWKQHLMFNIFMTMLSLAAWLRRPKRLVATNRSSRIPVI